jgi:hypothetical protein
MVTAVREAAMVRAWADTVNTRFGWQVLRTR